MDERLMFDEEHVLTREALQRAFDRRPLPPPAPSFSWEKATCGMDEACKVELSWIMYGEAYIQIMPDGRREVLDPRSIELGAARLKDALANPDRSTL